MFISAKKLDVHNALQEREEEFNNSLLLVKAIQTFQIENKDSENVYRLALELDPKTRVLKKCLKKNDFFNKLEKHVRETKSDKEAVKYF